jgi:hypothetical protein
MFREIGVSMIEFIFVVLIATLLFVGYAKYSEPTPAPDAYTLTWKVDGGKLTMIDDKELARYKAREQRKF